MRALSTIFALAFLSACEMPAGETPVATPPVATEGVSKYIVILQDGVDAFAGYDIIEIPEALTGEYAKLNDGILAALNAFNLRAASNEEGVTAHAKIRTSENDETTWSFELLNLPDDSVKAENYKVYFEKTESGFKAAQIGRRFKCYRNETPEEWTTELCP